MQTQIFIKISQGERTDTQISNIDIVDKPNLNCLKNSRWLPAIVVENEVM